MKNHKYRFWFATGISLWCLITNSPSQAQVASDGTLSTKVTTSDNLNFIITGGSRSRGNLFHSFREFSVPTGGTVLFDKTQDVQNIIGRVTGGSISNIDGLIRAQGSANLFLINPNGIIFGPNAQLEIEGSFLATTANRLNFADGNFFSAVDTQAQPLLTISVPVGLQFGRTAKSIVIQSSAANVGLQVKPSKTLAFLGGNILLDSGKLLAQGGRVELGSVAANSLVSLAPVAVGWTFGYEGVQNFQNIQLSNNAFVNVGGDNLGDIQLRGKQIAITGNSQVGGTNRGVNPGGTLVVTASESVEVSDGSSLNTIAFHTGTAGDIKVDTRRLIVDKDSFIDTSTNGSGQGGNLTVDASESVEVNGGGGLSRLATQASGGGNAGKLQVTTGRLILRDGGQISSSTFPAATGNGGTVSVDASESVVASGQGKVSNGTLETLKNSGLFVSSQGLGKAGNLEVTSPSISLDGGTFDAETVSVEGGNITLKTQDLLLRHSSNITTSASNNANGGNITINTNTLAGLESSKISANAIGGRGGNVNITALGLFLSPDSQITATSERGINGTVQINLLVNNASQGLVNLPLKPVDFTRLIAQSCPTGVGPRANKFVISGRGGLPPTPREALRSTPALVDLGAPAPSGENHAAPAISASPDNSTTAPIVEAQGWVVNSKGEVVLTAQAPTVTLHIPWLTPTTCHGS